MVPSTIQDLSTFERSHLVQSALRAVVTAGALLVLYFIVPIENHPHESVILRVSLALALFVAVLVNEIRLITLHDRPMLRAGVAMATVIPLFLVLFAWIYLSLSHSDPAAFGGQLDRVESLYFTVTVFSTVGFGDIAPTDRSGPVGGDGTDAQRPGRVRHRDPADPRGGLAGDRPAHCHRGHLTDSHGPGPGLASEA